MIQLFKIILYYLYIFFFLGLVFHTSAHPAVFHKYTVSYLEILVLLGVLFIPYIKLVQFIFKKNNVELHKKKITIYPSQKVLIICVIFILFMLSIEVVLRIKRIHFTQVEGTYSIKNFHPFLQHQLTPEMGSRYHSNEYGFRAGSISQKKLPGTYRIFLLGGSTVLNVGVPYEKNTSVVLQEMLSEDYPGKKIEVINAGNEGYTVEHSLIDYMYKIHDFSPDMVIMWHGINDMSYSCVPSGLSYGVYKSDYSHYLGSVTNMVKSYYTERPLINFNLVSYPFIDHFLRTNFYSDLFIYLHKTDSGIKKYLPTKEVDRTFQSIDSYRRNVDYAAKVISGDHVTFILGDQPYLYDKKLDNSVNWFMQGLCSDGRTHPSLVSLIRGMDQFNQATREVAEKNNVLFIPLEKQIPKSTEYFVDDVHLNEKGNKLTAEILERFIRDKQVIE